MLVLTRGPGESVKIDDEVEVVVLKVDKKQVRLGFKAPPEVIINRLEVHERIEREKNRVKNNNNKNSTPST